MANKPRPPQPDPSKGEESLSQMLNLSRKDGDGNFDDGSDPHTLNDIVNDVPDEPTVPAPKMAGGRRLPRGAPTPATRAAPPPFHQGPQPLASPLDFPPDGGLGDENPNLLKKPLSHGIKWMLLGGGLSVIAVLCFFSPRLLTHVSKSAHHAEAKPEPSGESPPAAAVVPDTAPAETAPSEAPTGSVAKRLSDMEAWTEKSALWQTGVTEAFNTSQADKNHLEARIAALEDRMARVDETVSPPKVERAMQALIVSDIVIGFICACSLVALAVNVRRNRRRREQERAASQMFTSQPERG